MTSIGADMLLREFQGSALAIAEALILGKLDSSEVDYAAQIVTPIVLQAAKIRLEALGKLNATDITPAPRRRKRS